MNHFTLSIPLILYIFSFLKDHQKSLNDYLKAPCLHLKVLDPLPFLFTFILMPLSNLSSLYQYQQQFPSIKFHLPSEITIFSPSKLKNIFISFISSMLHYKILLFQRNLLLNQAPALLSSNKFSEYRTLDIDGYSLVSYSHLREGSMPGHHRRRRGKPTLQATLSFIGNVFVDLKLFPGNTNVATFFQKAVKRAISIGYKFSIVRADTAYGHLKNLLFLEKLSLLYCLGIRISLLSIKDGIKSFKKLAKEKSSKIIHICKGSSIFDLGLVNVATVKEKPRYRRVILCRRIHRKKNKDGKWKVKEYYYAIVTNLDWSALKIFKYYHQRQCIENGLKELAYNYSFSKLHNNSLRVNEFWMCTKIFAQTLVKIFSLKVLGKRFVRMCLKTLLREVFGKTLHSFQDRKVYLLPKPKYLWHLRRIFAKIDENHFTGESFKIGA